MRSSWGLLSNSALFPFIFKLKKKVTFITVNSKWSWKLCESWALLEKWKWVKKVGAACFETWKIATHGAQINTFQNKSNPKMWSDSKTLGCYCCLEYLLVVMQIYQSGSGSAPCPVEIHENKTKWTQRLPRWGSLIPRLMTQAAIFTSLLYSLGQGK